MYDFAIRNDPYYVWSYAGKGWLLHNQDSKEEALASFNKAIELNPNKPTSYHYIANYYKNGLNDVAKSEEYYIKAIERDSFYLPAYKNIIELYNENNQEQKSLEVLNKLITWNSDAPDIWNLLGNTYFDLGDYPNAVKTYLKAIKIDSTFAKGYTNLVYSLMKTGSYSTSTEAYKKAVQYNPYKNDLESFSVLLLAESRKEKRNGNLNEAQTILREAYNLISNFETTFALAEFNYFDNKADEANKYLKSVNVEELSKTRKIKYLELACKITVDLNLKKESNEFFSQLRAINPRPNIILEALVRLANKNKKAAKESISKANPLLFKEQFLSKKYSTDAISKIKQLQKR